MHALARSVAGHTVSAERQINNILHPPRKNPPLLKSRPSDPDFLNWPRQQKAMYYIDAGQQTTKTIRTLLTQIEQGKSNIGKQADHTLLSSSIKYLLESIKPKLENDSQSQQRYLALLRMHLGGLTSTEIDKLKVSLQSSNFQCYITESVIDDEAYLEYGFSNGPPHCHNRTLLQATDLYRLLDELKLHAAARASADTSSISLTPDQVQDARNVLSDAAAFWMQSHKSLEVIQDTACRLALALDMQPMPISTLTDELNVASSTVEWKTGHLLIDLQILLQLPLEKNNQLYTRVLRDMLELLLTLKLTGTTVPPNALTHADRLKVLNAIEQITEHCHPKIANGMLHSQARAVMKRSAQFGQIQIKPGAGAALGHAWITPSLSLVPNKLARPHEIGSRYMHTGFNLAPDKTPIREWTPKFLTAKENEQIHPENLAWHLTVPANTLRLQAAARDIVQEWQENNIPYRFAGTELGMPATGCRTTVWQAIAQSLEPDALALFQHYNRGLPEPDSPTELWIRMHGLMTWIEQLARS